MNKYTKVRKIGEGSFGKAVLVRSKTNGEHYVIKEISISKMQPKERQEARKEVDLLSKMRHPYIVHYVESFEEVGCLYIVMEYCEGGDLYARINSQRGIPFSEAKILEWFVQICLALKHVHDRKILHRDIKTSNIFLTKTGVIKLGDFGIARVLNSTTELSKTWIGTPYYLSPEICENKPYNNKSDIWALGCVLYEVLTLKHAFEAGNMKNLVLKIIRGSYPPVPSRYSYDLRGLVGQLFRRNPRDRPSANTILRQPFVYKHVGKFLSPEQCQDEFSHTVLHKNRKPSASRPSSAQVKPEPRAVKSPVDYRAKQIAGVYGHAAAAAPKPSNAALKYKRLAEQRKKAQEQERKAKLDAMRKKKEEIERKQQQDLARLRLLQADKIRQRQLRKDRDRALQINLKRSSDIFDEKKNGREEKPSNKNDQALPAKLPRPTSAPSQVQPQRYEKYHQYLARMRQANDQRPVVNAPARNEPVREAWNEREGAQRAAMEAIGNKIEAQMGADRAQAASKYAKMREGAENQGRIMMHQQPKPMYPSQAAPSVPEVKGRNEEEKEYLKRLQQIRIQNFNERRAMEERRKGLQYMGNFKPAPDRLKQNKISALQKQRESVMQDGNVQKSPPNVVPAVNYLPEAKAPVGITQALGAIGVNHSPEINQQQYVEPKVTEPTPASPGPNPAVKKNILKRLNEKYLSEEPEKEQKPVKPRSAWANNPSAKASPTNMAGGDIGNVLAAKPLEETTSNQKASETMAVMKKWGQPSNTLVNRLNLLSLCDPTITLEDVDEAEETPGNRTRILPKPSIPANQQPPVKFTVNLGKTDDVPKSSVSDKPPVPKKGTVILGDKSAAALPSTPEVDETLSQPKPSRVASLAAKFGGAGKGPQQATFVVGNDNVTDGKESDAVPEEIVVSKSSDIKAITPQNSQLSPTQSSTKGSIDLRTPHASESASSTDAQTPKNSLDSADKPSSPTQEESKSNLNAVADSSSTEPGSSVTRTSSGDKESIEPKTSENVQATPSPAKLHKTMYATASDEMVLKITMGHFDSPNPKLLRTCSMPDLAKVGASNEKGPNPTSARRLSDGQALDDMDQEKSTVDSDLENDDDSCIGEVLSEDEEAESLMAKLENALQIGDMASSEEEDIEWESDGDDDSDTNDSDVSDTESVFSRLEANREELERELGFEEFMKAYKYVQAIHEDENDDMKDCEDRIRKILGKNHDRFYNKILQLVMADGAYCEDNN